MTRTRIAAALAALVLGLGCGLDTPDDEATDPDGMGQPAGQASAQAATPTQAGPMTKIPEGTWTVGVDIVAGTYRAVGASDRCYWGITKSGSNGSDIEDNHIGAGNLTVTLKVGQDFTSTNCPEWTKVG